MPRNVEIKARLRDPYATAAAARRLAGDAPAVIQQHDTFFACEAGRLKLRRVADGGGELIAYARPDARGPKTSRYVLYRTDDAEALAAVLGAGLRPLGEVRKTRRLHVIGRTRVHLDSVDGLGEFLELEVVLAEGEDPEAGAREARALLAALGVPVEDLVDGSYLDHLQAVKEKPGEE